MRYPKPASVRRIAWTLALGLAAMLGFVHLASRRETRDAAAPSSQQGTHGAITSPHGDARPRRHAVPRVEDVEYAEEETEVAGEATHEPAIQEAVDEPRPTKPQRVLRIVDGSGAPIPGAFIGQRCNERWCGARTDANGEVSHDAAGDAQTVFYFDGGMHREVVLADATTVCVVETLPRLDVSVVDARTGVALDPVRFTLRRTGAESRVAWTCGELPSLRVDTDGDSAFGIDVEPSAGYGGYRTVAWAGSLATRTRTVRFVVPVFDTTERTFRVQLADGSPAPGASVAFVDVASEPDHWRDPADAVTFRADVADATGLLRVSGLPRIPFTRQRIRIVECPAAAEDRAPLEATLAGIDPFADSSPEPIVVILDAAVEERDPSSASPPPDSVEYEGPTAPLAVRVVHRDGNPARRVAVCAGTAAAWTNDDGRAVFGALPVGIQKLTALAHGFVRTEVTADVGTVASIDVAEAEPRSVRVVVRDADGHAVSSASVSSRCAIAWVHDGVEYPMDFTVAQLDGDVELVTPLTDRRGEVVLRVPDGKVEYRATLGVARSSVTEEADAIVVVLHAPPE